MSAKTLNADPGSGFLLPQPDAAQELEKLGVRREFACGQVLFREHDTPDGFYLVRSGKVELLITGHLGADFRIRTAEPGDVIGLGAVISGRGREFTAKATTPLIVVFFPAAPLLAR